MSIAMRKMPALKVKEKAPFVDRLPVYQFTVKQYHRMIDTGILGINDRVELLEGWVVQKLSRNPPHNGSVGRINRRLVRILPESWVLRCQCAITLRGSEPEPDFAIVRGPEETYFSRHPVPRDIALLIEVADSTLLNDRRNKARIYAQARIPEYWIINLVDTRIEVYTRPRTGRSPTYRTRTDYAKGETIPLVLEGQRLAGIPVYDLFP